MACSRPTSPNTKKSHKWGKNACFNFTVPFWGAMWNLFSIFQVSVCLPISSSKETISPRLCGLRQVARPLWDSTPYSIKCPHLALWDHNKRMEDTTLYTHRAWQIRLLIANLWNWGWEAELTSACCTEYGGSSLCRASIHSKVKTRYTAILVLRWRVWGSTWSSYSRCDQGAQAYHLHLLSPLAPRETVAIIA